MPAERLTMRKLRELFRLRWCEGLSPERIAVSIGIGRTSVRDYVRRAAEAGITSWVQVDSIDEAELERRLFAKTQIQCGLRGGASTRVVPDWRKIHEERARPSVTLQLLWQEYAEENPEGLRYSRFAELYGIWKKKLSIVMRQEHRAGERCFVDYCDGLWLTDPRSGERKQTELFVGALGASSFTFAEATLTQALPEWLMSHCRMYEYFQGVPGLTVPDNLKSGVRKACYYDPEINPSYADLSVHYGTVILPARVRKPRDKAKVEAAVLVAQRWILARLRNRIFHTLAQMNQAIRECLEWLNNRKMRQLGKSRRELWEAIDRPALKPLPAKRYEFADWTKPRVNIDYHVEYDRHFYSGPYRLIQEKVDLRATAETVELFYKGERIASHVRSYVRGKYTTDPNHRPESHRAHSEWSPERMREWAARIGVETGKLVAELFLRKDHPEQAYRSVLGIIRLAKTYGEERVERASRRALALDSPYYKTIASMLKHGLESESALSTSIETQSKISRVRAHVRGKGYYH